MSQFTLPPGSSEALESSWKKYAQDVETVRSMFLNAPYKMTPQVRAQGYACFHQTLALAYNLVIAPNKDYPRFFTHTVYEPNVYTWLLPNPDFLYAFAFLDGARTYRITGNRRSTHWMCLQVTNKFWGEKGPKILGEFDFDDFEVRSDGSFELIASAQRQEGNWIPLDAASDNNFLNLRRAAYDWSTEVMAELQIEAIDGRPSGAMDCSEAELCRRVELAGETIKFATEFYTIGLTQRALQIAGGTNKFYWVDGKIAAEHGAAPSAIYGTAVYEIEPEEALIIESTTPKGKYWGFQMGDIWHQTSDYVHHKSSINGEQAVLDRDGKFRAVIALTDPGVPNWLDTVGNTNGVVLFRWYGAEGTPEVSTRKVRLSELRSQLPPETPVVSAHQRRAEIEQRSRDVMRRYGYRRDD